MIRTPKAMVVAGVMSGTSADGVDVAIVRVSPGKDGGPRVKALAHRGFAYPKDVREAVLRAMNADAMSVAELSRLHWRLGEVYADCVQKTAGKDLKVSLVGMHGQTIYHQAVASKYLGRNVRSTWQIGEAAVLAERLRVPVVSDFRAADLAAGGQGAPLVPMLDYTLFRSKTRNRVLLNLGGIANVTAIPAGAVIDDLLAFDTGPANMVVDALMQALYQLPFDRGGKIAARGKVDTGVLRDAMRDDYFTEPPPKSCGREQFGEAFSRRFKARCDASSISAQDQIATATELTVASILEAYSRFCWTHMGIRAPLAKATQLVAAGGGVKNAFLMRRLKESFTPLGVDVITADVLGIGSQAKEAIAFALLAWLSWNGMTGNVASATGAGRSVVLGKVTC